MVLSTNLVALMMATSSMHMPQVSGVFLGTVLGTAARFTCAWLTAAKSNPTIPTATADFVVWCQNLS